MNSFKTFMNKVGEKVRDVGPQSPNHLFGDARVQNDGVEGFVCPTCFMTHSTPEELEKHYSAQHLDPSANYLCPVCKARLTSATELEEHYMSVHGERDFNAHSVDALREELMELSTSLREEKWYSEELKKEVEKLQEAFQKKGKEDTDDVYVHKSQLAVVEETKNMMQSEVVLLRKQLTESLESKGTMRAEKDAMESRAAEVSVERAELRATLDSLLAEKVVLESELQDARTQLSQQQTQNAQELERMTQTLSQKEVENAEKDEQMAKMKARELALSEDLKEKSEMAASLREEIRGLKMEVDVMKKKHEDKCHEAELLSVELKSCKDSTNNEQHLPAVRVSEVQESGNETGEIAIFESRINTLETELKESRSNENNIKEMVKDRLRDIDDLKESLLNANKTINSKEKKIEELEKRSNLIETELKNMKVEFEREENELVAKNEKIKLIETELREDKARLSDLEVMLNKVEEELRDKKEDLQCHLTNAFNLKEETENLKQELQNMQKSLEEFKTKSEEEEFQSQMLKNKLELNEKQTAMTIGELQSTLNSLKITAAESDARLEEYKIKFQEFENTIMAKLEENTNLKNQLVEARSELHVAQQEKERVYADLTAESVKLQQKINSMIEEESSLTAAVGELEDTCKHLSEEKESLLCEIDAYKGSMEEIKTKLSVAEKDKCDRENSIAILQREKDEIRKEVSNKELEASNLIHTVEDLKAQLGEKEDKMSKMEMEMCTLAGDKLELEVKVEAANEEQNKLMERCVAAEKEVERAQQQLVQLRRKLDDCTAALHDLGRENQSLQLETNKLSNRKWADDSTATNCLACQKAFTVTVRRHHCRNCGQIFCNECSSKQAPLEPSQKPVRVCSECYTELLGKT